MSSNDPPRDTVELPDEIPFPRLMDFYDLQSPDHTQIHAFYENLRNGQLTTTQCRDCDALHFPPRTICPECTGDDLAYTELPHEGELFSFTSVRGTGPIGPNSDTPFVTGVVDLGDVRIASRIDEAEYDDLSIGDAVKLKIIDIEDRFDEERVFYRFVPSKD